MGKRYVLVYRASKCLTDKPTKSDKYKTKCIQKILTMYLRGNSKDEDIEKALDFLKADYYYPVLEATLRDKRTLENVSEELQVDRATVCRNRKRLLLIAYELLEESGWMRD